MCTLHLLRIMVSYATGAHKGGLLVESMFSSFVLVCEVWVVERRVYCLQNIWVSQNYKDIYKLGVGPLLCLILPSKRLENVRPTIES
ncbi:hypothetical protein M758_2G237600 [Ceratodon purpureus]|nr:hypothetical protein M758_2G237600 [Ceratodon purpureus]